jgi:hypothetical protein
MGNARVRSISKDLIAPELGFFEPAGNQHGSLRLIDFHGVLVGLLHSEAEKSLQHLDNVVITVVVIIEQDDIVKWSCLVLALVLFSNLGYGGRLGHCRLCAMSLSKLALVIFKRNSHHDKTARNRGKGGSKR